MIHTSCLILFNSDYPSFCDNFFVCHWNLISISVHYLVKIFLLCAYISIHHFDIRCLSEIYLDTKLPGYDLYRANHSSNVKRAGRAEVGVYIL